MIIVNGDSGTEQVTGVTARPPEAVRYRGNAVVLLVGHPCIKMSGGSSSSDEMALA